MNYSEKAMLLSLDAAVKEQQARIDSLTETIKGVLLFCEFAEARLLAPEKTAPKRRPGRPRKIARA